MQAKLCRVWPHTEEQCGHAARLIVGQVGGNFQNLPAPLTGAGSSPRTRRSARFVSGGRRQEKAVLARGGVDDRRAGRAHAADEFRRVERTERGGTAADLIAGPEPRARSDIAADAPAIAGVLEDAQSLTATVALRRVGDLGGKRGAVELAGARRSQWAADKEAEQRRAGEARGSFDLAPFSELT